MRIDFKNIACHHWNEIPAAVCEIVDDLETRVIPLQNESGNEWDVIRVEIWEDSGRMIAFPSKDGVTERVEVSGAQIICEEVRGEIENLDKSTLSDQDHSDQINMIVSRLARLFTESIPTNARFRFNVHNQDGEKIHAT